MLFLCDGLEAVADACWARMWEGEGTLVSSGFGFLRGSVGHCVALNFASMPKMERARKKCRRYVYIRVESWWLFSSTVCAWQCPCPTVSRGVRRSNGQAPALVLK